MRSVRSCASGSPTRPTKVGSVSDTDLPNRTFDVYTALQEHVVHMEAEHPTGDEPAQPPPEPVPTQTSMKRVIFWSHHLIAPSKRKQFAAWCPELQVWGLFKLGCVALLTQVPWLSLL